MTDLIKKLKIFWILFFVILSTIYLLQFSWKDILFTFSQEKIKNILIETTIFTLIYWMLRTLRLYWILKRLEVTVPIIRLYLITGSILGFSNFTPAQSGEVLKIEWLKREFEFHRVNGYGAFVIERILDLYVLCLLGFGILSNVEFWKPITILIFWGVILVLTIFFWILFYKVRLPGRLGTVLQTSRMIFSKPGDLPVLFFLTLCGWAMIILVWWFALKNASLKISYLETGTLVSGLTLLSVLSLIPGGMGVGDVALTEFLIKMGHPAVQAQVGALAVRATTLIGLIISGLFTLITHASRSK